MKPGWHLPTQTSLPTEAPTWPPSRILIEYDGPQLAIFVHRGGQYLGLAVDESEHAVRWLFAELSDLEYEGLLRRGASIRSALSKDRVLVVDHSHEDRNLAVWETDARHIPTAALPDPGALLPTSVRRHLLAHEAAQSIAQPLFRLGRARVPFGDLSVFLGKIQAFWNVAAQAQGDTFSVLEATAVAPGSLALQVYTNNVVLFEQIAERYRRLVIVTDDAKALNERLNDEPPAVASAYREYLQAVAGHQIEVLAEWGEDAAYLRHRLAERTEAALEVLLQPDDDEKPIVEPVRYRGYFKGFWTKSKPRFEFHDLNSGEEFTGPIDAALKQAIVKRELFPVLGRRQVYDVLIDVERSPDTAPKYRLKEFDPVAPLDSEPGDPAPIAKR